MSKESENFFQMLKASCRFKPEPETEALFKSKLSSWKLSKAQWTKALDMLIEDNKEPGLPLWSQILDVLRAVKTTAEEMNALGWCTFDLDGRKNSIRIKSVDGGWKTMEMRRFPDINYPYGKLAPTGQTTGIHLPAGATNVHYNADHPTDEPLEDHRKELANMDI
jgi:hypothetical protein